MVDWKDEYDRLQRTCSAQGSRSGRDLALFGAGAIVSSGVAYGLWRWRKGKGCACAARPIKAASMGEGPDKSKFDNGKNGDAKNGDAKNGDAKNGDANANNDGQQGGMAPGDS